MAASRQLKVTVSQLLIDFLLDVPRLKRRSAKNLIKYGGVSVNGTTTRRTDHRLAPGDEITLGSLPAAAAAGRMRRSGIAIVHEDEALIVVDKPAGLLTVATDHERTDTLFVRLNEYLRHRDARRSVRVLVIHRLDQATSGLVLFAKSDSVKRQMQSQWSRVEKLYVAFVQGRPLVTEGTIRNYLTEDPRSLMVSASDQCGARSQLAVSHYRVLATRGGISRIEVRLETGRKHQIRVHLAGLGCPVHGDRRYGDGTQSGERLALHASEIWLEHPLTGAEVRFRSPLPTELAALTG